MKPTPPHDSFDDLIAAALHGDLTPEERAQFESRLQSDPNAQAVYQEAKAMHELLEKTNKSAQPDPDFEQRMVSAVRRKLTHPPHDETAWESLLVLGRAITGVLRLPGRLLGGASLWMYGGVASLVIVVAFTFLLSLGNQTKSVFTTITSQLGVASRRDDFVSTKLPREAQIDDLKALNMSSMSSRRMLKLGEGNVVLNGGSTVYTTAGTITSGATGGNSGSLFADNGPASTPSQQSVSITGSGGLAPAHAALEKDAQAKSAYVVDSNATALPQEQPMSPAAPAPFGAPSATADSARGVDGLVARNADLPQNQLAFQSANKKVSDGITYSTKAQLPAKPSEVAQVAAATAAQAPADTRKLIRNAQLDLQVKSYQSAIDQVSALTKSADGYVDTSNSQRGGNGKLQGTVVVKILPENLDAFLLKLRDLGEVQNQQVSTDDVTKDYFDTQARLANSQKMEVQLQELLKRENGKVSDLLAVERELGRVRGDIEQMQGQLKLYDFQVQYATVTMNLAEKDLNQAAAYLLKEQDTFALFATDVEGAFKKARAAADQFNAQVLSANLEHDVSSDNNQVGATLVVMVAPDQIEPFLTQVRGLGRVANFTRQTQRVAKDGGDNSQPTDETRTEKDKARVQLSIRSDDDSRKQVAITVVTKDVNDALDQAKVAALANEGTEILGSALNTSPQGASTAQLSVRVPGKEYTTLMDAFRALGRRASLTIQRNDNAGPGASGDDVPVIVTLALTDNDAPVQETNLVLSSNDVDTQAQQIKKQAGDAGVEIKSSSFERQPDGTELAQMTLRLPLGHYPAFLAALQQAGKTESLSVQRSDRPDQTRPDESAPAEIQLQLHNQPAIVPDNSGLFATLRDTFAQGFGALFGSVKVIGVIVAFLIPWLVTLVLLAWIGRRIYVWKKNR